MAFVLPAVDARPARRAGQNALAGKMTLAVLAQPRRPIQAGAAPVALSFGRQRVASARSGWRDRVPTGVKSRPCTRMQASSASAQSAGLPFDDSLSGPNGETRFEPSRWTEGLRGDIKRRLPWYWSDWKDGMVPKTIPAVLFMYFACLAPVVAFGGLTSVLTNGAMGVVEFLLSAGLNGVVYAIFSGQPLTIIGPTGLTLAFTTALYGYCTRAGVNFLGTYAWVGIWTSFILFILSIANVSDLIRYCTRFTDDVFNALIALNFLYEATRSLLGGFANAGIDKTKPFMAMTLALGTFILGRTLAEFRRSRYLRRSIRTFLSDFGPITAIATMSALAQLPSISSIQLESLQVPAKFALANGRKLLVPIFAVPMHVRLIAFVPALLLTCLFYLDQNISVRVVNQPAHKLKKGVGYHLDLLMLAICTLVSSLFGLPWMCAATVQSLNHVRSIANYGREGSAAVDSDKDGESSDADDSYKEVVTSVVESRVSGAAVHGLIAASLMFLPLLRKIPIAVISGLFLYLGRNMMTGNQFFQRIRLMFVDPKLYPSDSPMRKVKPLTVFLYTLIQTACLALLFVLKVIPATSIFFPTVIGTLMLIRRSIVGQVFSSDELLVLDGDIAGDEGGDDYGRPLDPQLG
ncbi:Band 3 anion transport protein [Porphyridium purpureum]|uniref:Band 3 anion transport protein n=1 Tax=Porphyridium purpureum TaxID=35688 RepID=A0A5J4Z0I7_PORPP|nr:Band 3 anion transport protein [Porphyridium purpureum]|eukprot:POR7342..scf208_2